MSTRAEQGVMAAGMAPVSCAHCTLPVPPGLIRAADDRQFCCAGCRAAFDVLHAHGLDRYYDQPARRDRPVVATGRRYEEFDHPAFHALYVGESPGGLSRVDLYLEGVHCASCVWLVERVPLIVPGVSRAELDVRRSLATIEWDAGATPLSAVAQTLDSLGYVPHPYRSAARDDLRKREDRAALTRIGVAGALATNVMLASLALYSGWWSGMEATFERFFRWTAMLLTVPALVWPGRVFFTSALASLRTRAVHMDLPIAVALGVGFLRGVMNTVGDSGPVYFDGVAMLVFLLLCGRYLQSRGQRAAADASELLFSMTPATGRVVGPDGVVREAPAEGLLPGDVLDVRPGETLAADGVIASGRSTMNLAMLTGESRPVAVQPDDEVFAGTMNIESPVRVRVTRAAEASRLAKLVRQVEEGARRRAPVVLYADRLAGWFTLAVLVLAVVVYAWWLRLDPARAADHAIALLIVTCPCALALATPLAMTAAVGRAARRGILVKGADALEQLATPSTVLLDKTGTITEGAFSLVSFEGPDWVKPLVVALEAESTHPVAVALRNGLGLVVVPEVESSRHVIGAGITGRVAGHDVVIGKPAFVRASIGAAGAAEPESLVMQSVVLVAVDGAVVATARLGDAIRPEAAAAIAALRTAGWQVGIASGDSQAVVDEVARRVGVEPHLATGNASPEEKLAMVERAARQAPVVMVGDGVNDAAAIAAASVGIGVHGGAEASLAAADVYLTRPGLSQLVELTVGARRTMGVIRTGIVLSLVYNAAGVALAVFGLISPLVAAIMMPASSLTVMLVAWRGRTFGAEDTAA